MSEQITLMGMPKTLEEKKSEFLQKIKSKNGNSMNEYKRVAESPIRYAGGKSLAVGHIIELLPDDVKRLERAATGAQRVVDAMMMMYQQDTYDCETCEYQDVCDTVMDLKKIRKKLDDLKRGSSV